MTISTEQFTSINTGIVANDGRGDTLRAAFIKVNENFANISDVGFDAGNISVRGAIQAVGNISAEYFVGDGRFISNVTAIADYTDSNVAAYLPTYDGDLSAANVIFSDDSVQSTAYAGGQGRAMMIDTNRTDDYIEVGSADRPFKTFAAAIAAAEDSDETTHQIIFVNSWVSILNKGWFNNGTKL
jgi:hypothetical protein